MNYDVKAGVMAATSPANTIVTIRSLSKQFRREDGTKVPAIDDISIDVADGEILVLLGPSGCGKTTLLRSIAGLERPDTGVIQIADKAVYSSEHRINLNPEDRRVSMIFQSYALWPHMTAFKNVAYPLESRGVPAAEIKGRVDEALRLVGIPELVQSFPSDMSGGQQQRVALARAIVSKDRLVLFDEPLSNVDAKVRQQLRFELLEMQRKLGFSAIYVTHDQTEAMALAHRIAVLREGKIEQIGTPQEVYDLPVSRYVANFVGITNEVPGEVVSRLGARQLEVKTALGTFAAGSDDQTLVAGDKIVVIFRPERVSIATAPQAMPNALEWESTLEATLFLGSYSESIARVGDQIISIWTNSPLRQGRGTPVFLSVDHQYLRAVRE